MFKKIFGKIKNADFKKPSFSLIFGHSWFSKCQECCKRCVKSGKAFLGKLSIMRASRKFKIFLDISGVLAFLVFLYITIIGVLIYGFKYDTNVIRITSKIVPYPIAIVNYDFISYKQYLSEVDYIHHFYTATQQEGIDYKEIDRQIVDQLVENRIVDRAAQKYKITVARADEDQVINGIIDQNGGEEKVTKVLNDMYGIDLNAFRKLVNIQIKRDKLNQKIIARVEASHILIKVAENSSEADIAAAKAKIDSILAEIRGGLDFAEGAKKYSEDSGSAQQGGSLEAFAKGEMVTEFSDTAFATKVGDISDPIRTTYGWHIIKVQSRTGLIEQTFADWLLELKKKSFVMKLYEI